MKAAEEMKREEKFRKKPVIVEAFQFTDESKDAAYRWASSHQMNIQPSFDDYKAPILLIPTLEGEMICRIGDWIIRGVNGEFYPCKPDIFEKTYEPATPLPPAEGAEEILQRKNDLYPLWNNPDTDEKMNHNDNMERYRKGFDSGVNAATDFATLHAQQIADKMVDDMRQKLFSMRATKKTMDMLSEADRLITYGYHDCINEMLMWTKSREK